MKPQEMRGAIVFGQRPPRLEFVDLPVDPETVQPFEVPARDDVAVQCQPQLVFRGITLRILPSARGVILRRLRVGAVDCLAMQVPAEQFASPDLLVELPTCEISQRITLNFENHSHRGVSLRCWIEGRYLR